MLQSWFKNNACNVTKILKLCFKFNYLCVETSEFFFFSTQNCFQLLLSSRDALSARAAMSSVRTQHVFKRQQHWMSHRLLSR